MQDRIGAFATSDRRTSAYSAAGGTSCRIVLLKENLLNSRLKLLLFRKKGVQTVYYRLGARMNSQAKTKEQHQPVNRLYIMK